MRQEEAFEFLCRLAQGIASMFGDSCETVVHGMEGERMKNLVIFNGHVSGRLHVEYLWKGYHPG